MSKAVPKEKILEFSKLLRFFGEKFGNFQIDLALATKNSMKNVIFQNGSPSPDPSLVNAKLDTKNKKINFAK